MIPAHGGLELLGPAKATRLLRESQDVTGCDREVVGSTAGQGELVLRTHDCTSSAGRNNQQTLSSPYQTPTNHPPFTGFICNQFFIFEAIVDDLKKRVLVFWNEDYVTYIKGCGFILISKQLIFVDICYMSAPV